MFPFASVEFGRICGRSRGLTLPSELVRRDVPAHRDILPVRQLIWSDKKRDELPLKKTSPALVEPGMFDITGYPKEPGKFPPNVLGVPATAEDNGGGEADSNEGPCGWLGDDGQAEITRGL